MIRHSKPTIDGPEIKKVSRVLMSGDHATGEMVERFEKRLSLFIGARHGIAVNSGTSALYIALLALGVKANDEVIMPSFVCTAPLNAVNYISAKAVLADIDEDTFNIDYRSVLTKLTKSTRALIIPHMFGLPVNLKPFLDLGVPVIEDCAQSLGAGIDGKRSGSFGRASVFSFYATKLISTGYGGMLVSNSKTIMDRTRDLLDFDERDDYKIRFNYNMTDFQAALGLSQLDRLNAFIRKRIEIASYYNERFDALPVKLPIRKSNIYYRYVIKANKGSRSIIARLKKYGVEAKRPVFKPLHRYLCLAKSDFPGTERAFRESISLPIYPGLKKSNRQIVADSLIKILSGI